MKKTVLIIAVIWICCLLVSCGAEPQAPEVPDTTAEAQEQTLTVVKLEVVSLPEKTKYVTGEDFDTTGLVINAIMSDGSVVENVEWTVDEDLTLISTTTGVKVYYGGKTVMIPVLVRHPGNVEAYHVSNFPALEDSPLQGKTYFWLGSSVTVGASAMNESMADYIAKKYACICIKEAVSGTTLANNSDNSYVARFDAYLASGEKAEHVDAVIVQLSTNDQLNVESFGTVTADDVRDPGSFDTSTTFGAMEYIIATAKQEWDCPVLFYTNPPTGYESYMTMVFGLYDIAAKWDVDVIDLFMDLEFNNIPTAEQRKLWMVDKIHPSKAGYRDWWLPKFEEALLALE